MKTHGSQKRAERLRLRPIGGEFHEFDAQHLHPVGHRQRALRHRLAPPDPIHQIDQRTMPVLGDRPG